MVSFAKDCSHPSKARLLGETTSILKRRFRDGVRTGTMKYRCLSIVSPNGMKIAEGKKTIEVRSWKPDLKDGEDLLIIENGKFLTQPGNSDPNGRAVALVKVGVVREYEEADIPAACASRWDPGYFSWELYDVRPIASDVVAMAARDIYELELDIPDLTGQ